jgi:hypothetical protein
VTLNDDPSITGQASDILDCRDQRNCDQDLVSNLWALRIRFNWTPAYLDHLVHQASESMIDGVGAFTNPIPIANHGCSLTRYTASTPNCAAHRVIMRLSLPEDIRILPLSALLILFNFIIKSCRKFLSSRQQYTP